VKYRNRTKNSKILRIKTKGASKMQNKETVIKLNNQQTGAQKEDKNRKKWHKPKLEDVSGKVMAQPYIRFT